MLRDFLQRLHAALRGTAGVEPGRTAPGSNAAAARIVMAPSERLCAISDVGRTRRHNEDLVHLSGDGRVMIVADGMGGHAAGEVASALAIAAILEYLDNTLPGLASGDVEAMRQALRAALHAAQQRVLAEAECRAEARGMGCTLVLACVDGATLHVCHVGDARAYLWRRKVLRALTRDHSFVAELIEAGTLTADEARAHPAKNEVLQAIGMPEGFAPEVNSCRIEPGDRVLLCSDGLWEMLPEAEIAAITGAAGSMHQPATRLIDGANDAGGHDNVSVALYEHASA